MKISPYFGHLVLPLLILWGGCPLLWASEEIDTAPLMEALNDRLLREPVIIEVKQTKILPSLSQPVVTQGMVWLIPGRAFRWEQGIPLKTVAIYDGTKVYVLDERTKKADLFDPDNRKVRSMMLLLGMGKTSSYEGVMKNFKPLSLQQEKSQYTLQLAPQSSAMKRFLSELTLIFEPAESFPRSVSWTQKDGTVVTTEFKSSQTDWPFNENLFAVTKSHYEW